ncbi:MAG: L-serine ammonia-lyase, iron-sulfur-dependent, subunit alpha [Bacillota bacterium]|nr:L-serine ammonia-lyase, iron-sulfur-dependent, subunit alpha [Bacillota bacterium]
MNKIPPSIFNDVIGPIMRGPSSSHTAAAVRIGTIVRQFLGNPCRRLLVEFAPHGSLATTYKSQGSDIGLVGGLIGMELTDDRLVNALDIARNNGIKVTFKITDFEASHPNTYRISATTGEKGAPEFRFSFISTGGGMIELISINGIPISVSGGYHETIFFVNTSLVSNASRLEEKIIGMHPEIDTCRVSSSGQSALVNIKTAQPAGAEIIDNIRGLVNYAHLVQLAPVLPVHSRKSISVPFKNASELLIAASTGNKELWELALLYESQRSNLAEEQILRMGKEVLAAMKGSIEEGLSGTVYSNRILGPQAAKVLNHNGALIGGSLIKNLIAYITAAMETKSAMGVIVAAPTAGSCAGLPGTLFAAAEDLGSDDTAILKGLLAAGITGILIINHSTFAAEECGCQAECGSGSAMTAAGLVQMAGGTVETALSAASMAMQNIIGMICDPVANRVEVPCLGKNILAGMNAVASANMALCGFDQVIPFDETIAAFDQAGRMIPAELRCTGKAGLSVTPTSLRIHKKLNLPEYENEA